MADVRSLDARVEPIASYLLHLAIQAGLNPVVTSARRGYASQARLYRRAQRGESRYPAAPPGTSTHERGLAFDLVVSPKSALTDLGRLWESWGFTWGGRFNDPIHFDVRPRRRR